MTDVAVRAAEARDTEFLERKGHLRGDLRLQPRRLVRPQSPRPSPEIPRRAGRHKPTTRTYPRGAGARQDSAQRRRIPPRPGHHRPDRPPIVAASGTVIDSGPASGYGLWIRIQHANGVVTIYGHNNRPLVTTAQSVQAGCQLIAEVGHRSQSTGPTCTSNWTQAASPSILSPSTSSSQPCGCVIDAPRRFSRGWATATSRSCSVVDQRQALSCGSLSKWCVVVSAMSSASPRSLNCRPA